MMIRNHLNQALTKYETETKIMTTINNNIIEHFIDPPASILSSVYSLAHELHYFFSIIISLSKKELN